MCIPRFATLTLSLLLPIWILVPIDEAGAQRRRSQVSEGERREQLLRSTETIRNMSEEQVRALVPTQSGLNYVGCPNCRGGRQEGQLSWSIERPDVVTCRYCNHVYPSDQYPMRDATRVHTPTGKPVEYPYWQNSDGYRHYFAAKRDDEARKYMASQASQLAMLYELTHDETFARRAAVILVRFAEVFPDWCYHFDYPFRQKEIYDGPVDPAKFRPGYRTARWNWWAYSDVPLDLVQTFERIERSEALSTLASELNVDLKQKIEQQLIRAACDQVLANQETHSNMSPTAWYGLTMAGRAIHEPAYVHEVTRRLQDFVDKQFFYDGIWGEGSPDYDSQSVGGLQRVLQSLAGYSDPPDYRDPVDGKRFDNLDLSDAFPALPLLQSSLARWRLPDGRSVPVHDTWPTSKRGASNVTEPYLLPGVGHVCLGGGQGANQTQLHMTWSGAYGHSHGDNLSLLLFSQGRELLSDLGYTHSAYRAWTLATVAHNTVVIDGLNQTQDGAKEGTDGRLLRCDYSNPKVQYVSADGSRGYPGIAKTYQRSLVMVTVGEGRAYTIDRFDVTGGQVHDYFLHGWADGTSSLRASVPTEPRGSLLPAGFDWKAPVNEGQTGLIARPHYAYGFLKNLRHSQLPAGGNVSIDIRCLDESVSPATLRVHVLPQTASEFITGENPSIRQAGENDSRLEQFQRPFLMLRQSNSSNDQALVSRFLSVIEPFGEEATIREVEQVPHPQATVLKLKIAAVAGERVDWVILGANDSPVTIPGVHPSLQFQGEVGFVSILDGTARDYYGRGDSRWTSDSKIIDRSDRKIVDLSTIQDEQLVVPAAGSVPKPGSVIIMKTADGWHYPFTVRSTDIRDGKLSIAVHERMAFQWDGLTLKGTMFPGRTHRGVVKLEWE